MPRRKTHEEFKVELKEKRPELDLLSFYVNNTTKVKVRDNDCGHIWEATPHNLLRGSGCLQCYTISRTDTHEEFVEKLKKVNPNIEVLSKYITSRIKIKVMCLLCGHVWDVKPNQLIQGYGCRKCKIKASTKTNEKFLEELSLINPDIEPLDVYAGYETGISVMHLTCGNIWEAKPRDLLQGCGCPECSRKSAIEKLTRDKEDVLAEIEEKYPGLFECIGEYINTRLSCWWRCKKCGHVWKARPRDILEGSGCPVCLKDSMEKPILELLERKGILPLHDVGLVGSNYNGSSHPLRVDFIIETSKGKLAVEADGRHHFLRTFGETDEDLKNVQARDRHKDKILKERGYILIRITSSPTKEWGTEKHITMQEFFDLVEKGINSETGEIDFELFRQYDFNRE